MTTRMQSCVDHIKTSLDVDPWAMELVDKIFTEYDRRFDEVLEIVNRKKMTECNFRFGEHGEIKAAMNMANAIYEAVEALKGGVE